MKDKKAEKLYDCITNVDDQFIQEALETPKIKSRKKTMLIKWGTIAACFVVAVIAVFLLFSQSAGTISELETVASSEHSNVSNHPEKKEDEKIDWKNPPTKDGEIWGEIHSHGAFADEDNEHTDLSIKPNLEGFQYAKNPDSYKAPKDGAYIMTDSLKAAIKKYGNQVTYRIHLSIYKDKNKLDSRNTEVQKWFNELSPSIIVTYSDSYNGSVHSYNFYMDACSYEDLIAFCNIESEYGFILSLYRESNGDLSQQEQTSPHIFNTPDIVE